MGLQNEISSLPFPFPSTPFPSLPVAYFLPPEYIMTLTMKKNSWMLYLIYF